MSITSSPKSKPELSFHPVADVDTVKKQALAVHADAIRCLGKRATGDIVEIGKRLSECKVIAGHGKWLPWLEREFGWKERTAQRIMQVADAFGSNASGLTHLALPAEALYLLSAPSTPKEVRKEIIERAEKGEKVKGADIKAAVKATKKSVKASALAAEVTEFLCRHRDEIEPYYESSIHGAADIDEAACVFKIKEIAKGNGFALISTAPTVDLRKALRAGYARTMPEAKRIGTAALAEHTADGKCLCPNCIVTPPCTVTVRTGETAMGAPMTAGVLHDLAVTAEKLKSHYTGAAEKPKVATSQVMPGDVGPMLPDSKPSADNKPHRVRLKSKEIRDREVALMVNAVNKHTTAEANEIQRLKKVVIGLEGEIADLKKENADLRAKLEAQSGTYH